MPNIKFPSDSWDFRHLDKFLANNRYCGSSIADRNSRGLQVDE
jgi:hypothetical protein